MPNPKVVQLPATLEWRTHLRALLVFGLAYNTACHGSEKGIQPGSSHAPPRATTTPLAPPPTVPSSTNDKDKDKTKVVKFDIDTPLTTPSGSKFIAPKGWTVTTKIGFILLEDPNHEVSVSFVERKERTANAAIAASWQLVHPGVSRKMMFATPRPGRSGWDAFVFGAYETTVAEARDIWVNAARKADTWFVTLFDGTKEGWGKRWPQADLAQGSFRANGVVEESFAGKTAHLLDAERLGRFEEFIEQGRRVTNIPGLAVAVVQGSKVVFEKGFGVKELGKADPATPNTMFRIASMTKPLTSLMIASLVDEGRLAWDTSVTKLMPSFALGDAALTQKLTMRNILCACTGIPYDNVGTVFESAGLAPENMLERMKDLKPTTGFGETFQYSNAMIAAAGFVAGHAATPKQSLAVAYENAMQTKVFDPLGMKHTTFDSKIAARSDHASPHNRNARFDIELSPTDAAAWIAPMNPGGGAWSTVRDLSRVLLMEIAKGRTPDGKQVVSEPNLLARREPQARAGEKQSYGLALDVEEYKGVRVYGHAGGLWGYTSYMFFVPDHGVAAVMLTNVGFPNSFVHRQFRQSLFEVLFDGREEAREDLALEMKEQLGWRAKENAKTDFAPDSGFFDPFVGTYEHPLYGRVTIRYDAKQGAVLDVGEWSSTLGKKRVEDGTFKLVTTTAPWIGWPEFVPKQRDGQMTLELQDGQRMVVFVRNSGEK